MSNNSLGDRRYYRTRLTPLQKSIYKTILAGLKSHTVRTKVPAQPINEISRIFTFVLLDNPLIFFTAAPPFNYISMPGRKSEVLPNYKFVKQIAKQYSDEVNLYLQRFDSFKVKPDVEKVQIVHDYCLEHFSYDHGAGEHAHSILGPILHRTAVCEGIAKFLKLALDYLDVKNLIVTGKAKDPAGGKSENHAWNIVKLDGKTYHVDVTFDMTLSVGEKRYDYFCLCDEDIKKDHIITGNVPTCTTKGEDYYSKNFLVARSPMELKDIIGKNLRQNKQRIVIKAIGKGEPESLQNKIVQIAVNQHINVHNRSVAIECNANIEQMVFEVNFK
ncbi:MAG: hypothetical protein FWC13_10995 [Oscillospiraceae bacterium]|nr:hypothetical protein [Oscillospiraceae bacterium]